MSANIFTKKFAKDPIDLYFWDFMAVFFFFFSFLEIFKLLEQERYVITFSSFLAVALPILLKRKRGEIFYERLACDLMAACIVGFLVGGSAPFQYNELIYKKSHSLLGRPNHHLYQAALDTTKVSIMLASAFFCCLIYLWRNGLEQWVTGLINKFESRMDKITAS